MKITYIEMIIAVFLLVCVFRGCIHHTSAEYEIGKEVNSIVEKFNAGFNNR